MPACLYRLASSSACVDEGHLAAGTVQASVCVAKSQLDLGRTLEALLKQEGIDNLNVAAQMNEVSLVRELVMAGAGYSCSLRRNVARDLAAGSIAELDVDVAPLHLELGLRAIIGRRRAEIKKLIAVLQQPEFQS